MAKVDPAPKADPAPKTEPAPAAEPAPKVPGIPARPLFTTTTAPVSVPAVEKPPLMSEKTKAEMAAGVAALNAYRTIE